VAKIADKSAEFKIWNEVPEESILMFGEWRCPNSHAASGRISR